jgi:hemolysin activation/secretion protein
VADNTSIAIYQDIYKKDENKGVVFAEFAAKDKTVKMNTGVYSRDRFRILKFGGDFNFRGAGSVLNISPEFSQGITAFGASSMNNPLASRGARPNFSKFVLGMKYKKILPHNIQFNARIKGQAASTKLAPQEEFGLGGLDSVRGYPDSDYLADNAVIENLELVFPAFFLPQKIKMPFSKGSLKQNTSFVIFSDYGWGMRRAALSTEKKEVNYLSAGTGLRINLFDKAVMRLEWGFPLGANNPITEHGRSQFHFSVDFQY